MKHEYKNAPFANRLLFAFHGLKHVWRFEKSFRLQTFCCVGLIGFCLLVRPTLGWCALFAISCGLVQSLEVANSAMEHFLDKLFQAHDVDVGIIKDCMAGAVLLASFSSLLVFALFLLSLV